MLSLQFLIDVVQLAQGALEPARIEVLKAFVDHRLTVAIGHDEDLVVGAFLGATEAEFVGPRCWCM